MTMNTFYYGKEGYEHGFNSSIKTHMHCLIKKKWLELHLLEQLVSIH
jgi:hypothetical protein